MNRGGWTLALLLGAMALWTLLARGVAGVLAAPGVGGSGRRRIAAGERRAEPVPQAVLDARCRG